MAKKFLCFAFIILCLSSYGQIKYDSVLNKNISIIHFGTFSDLIDKISNKYQVKFNYDTAKFYQFDQQQLDFENVKFSEALKRICNLTKSKYVINNIGTIYLIDKFKDVDPKAINVTVSQQAVREFKGAPEKKNFSITGKIIDKKTELFP